MAMSMSFGIVDIIMAGFLCAQQSDLKYQARIPNI
jgi:hypothetical protein